MGWNSCLTLGNSTIETKHPSAATGVARAVFLLHQAYFTLCISSTELLCIVIFSSGLLPHGLMRSSLQCHDGCNAALSEGNILSSLHHKYVLLVLCQWARSSAVFADEPLNILDSKNPIELRCRCSFTPLFGSSFMPGHTTFLTYFWKLFGYLGHIFEQDAPSAEAQRSQEETPSCSWLLHRWLYSNDWIDARRRWISPKFSMINLKRLQSL